ncbi:DUF349 domain-containing protein [Moheibacter stercoris]|uniref:DUF349 domain-containing protein n=1 Tax=Moheibacter stercoris TaxID=1628251 RepID=A0ABV2LSL9_9FLAO
MTTELDNLHNEADGEKAQNLNSQENTQDSTENQPVENENSTPEESPVNTPSEEAEDYKVESHEEEAEEVENVEEEIPFKNYDDFSVAILIGEAKDLLAKHPARKLREHFNQIRDAVKRKLDEEESMKRDAFLEEGGEAADFHYDNPARREFNAVYNDYRRQIDSFYKEQEKNQQENLKERLQIIDELKALYQEQNTENTNIFSIFRNLKTRWHNAGPVPKAQAGNVFKTYFHHLDNFYEYLDFNKELRELDYAHNLQVRESIIKRAEELVGEENVQKALNELQYLHRLWKEEAVPVAEEMREVTWQKFKDLTHKIHDRKAELGEKIKAEQEENLTKKQAILDEIAVLSQNPEKKSHGEWQSGIKRLNTLRENFLAIGRVPKEYNQKMWDAFKAATRDFNHSKNEFYKSLKSEQQTNLEKKQELLRIAKEHANSTDWNASVQVIKRIQADWKKIGHVPRKFSDSIWKEFKDACNLFFDNYKERGNQVNQAFEENFVKKEALLEEVRNFKTQGNAEADLSAVNDFNVRWNSIGKVPAAKMSINQDFNKAINEIVKSLGLSDNEIQDFKMAALVDQIKSGQDGRLLDDEIRKSRKMIDDLEKEINQLETNVGFFANANADSPLLKDVFKQIEEKRSRLVDTEIRLRKLLQIDFNDEVEENQSNQGEEQSED